MATVKKMKDPNGQPYWKVRWRAEGRQCQQRFRSAKLANAFKATVEVQAHNGNLRDPRRGAVRFADYAEDWLASRRVKGLPLASGTRTKYEQLLRLHINPTLGRTKIVDIQSETVRGWYGDLAKAMGQDAAAKSYRLLRAIMNTAVADDLIIASPCRIRGGGTEHAAKRWCPPVETILDMADAIDPKWRAFCLIAGFAGLRTGEQLGLIREDIDLANGTIRVERQACEDGDVETDGQRRVIRPPKSEAGIRTVNIDPVLVDALEHHLRTYVEPFSDSVLFTNPCGSPVRRADVGEAWAAARSAIGAPETMVPHDFRHRAATLTAGAKVPLAEIMARIGHSSPRAALLYQHATREGDVAVASHIADVIANTRRRPMAPVVPIRKKEAG